MNIIHTSLISVLFSLEPHMRASIQQAPHHRMGRADHSALVDGPSVLGWGSETARQPTLRNLQPYPPLLGHRDSVLAPVLLTEDIVKHYVAAQDTLLAWLRAGKRMRYQVPQDWLWYSTTRANGTDTGSFLNVALNVVALATTEPTVKAIFTAHQLAPTQFYTINVSIRNAQRAAWDVRAGLPLTHPESVAGQNVRFVLAHCRDFEERVYSDWAELGLFPWKCQWLDKLGATPRLPQTGATEPGSQGDVPEPPLLPLTPDVIRRFVAVQSELQSFWETSHTLTDDVFESAVVHIRDPNHPTVVGEAVVDGARLATLEPVAAAIFRANDMTPAQFLPLTQTLRSALDDLRTKAGASGAKRQGRPVDSTSVIAPTSVRGMNVSWLRQHCELVQGAVESQPLGLEFVRWACEYAKNIHD